MVVDTRFYWNTVAYIREFLHRKPRMSDCWQFFAWSQLSSAQLQWCLVSLILFGISGGVPVLIFLFLMIWWRCLDDLLVKVFRMHKLRGSLSHMERMFRCTFSGGALALLSIMHCWHYVGSEICSLSWGLSGVGLKVMFVIWWKGLVETHVVKL